jgi:hypothetical protein
LLGNFFGEGDRGSPGEGLGMVSGRLDFSFHHPLESDDGGDREAMDLDDGDRPEVSFGGESLAKFFLRVILSTHFAT